MGELYPQYGFTEQDVEDTLVRYVQLDNPKSYPFDSFHSHSYNEIMYFTKGGGIHNINFKEDEIHHHSLHLLSAGDLHWVERSLQSEGFAIVYKDAFLYKLQDVNRKVNYLEYFNNSAVVNLTSGEADSLALLISEIKNNRDNHLYIFNLIGAFFTKLVIEKEPADTRSKSKTEDGTVKQFYELVQANYSRRLNAADYARMLYMSPTTLERKIKNVTGKSIYQLQQEYLLKEAKRLLLQTDFPLKDVADKLGFRGPAHFSNWFKKLTTEQPGVYRK